MQYILNEEEYKTLNNKRSYEISLSKKKLQDLCTNIANHMPVQEGWYKGKPWKCILNDDMEYEWYCDDCPVQQICPYEYKSYSQ